MNYFSLKFQHSETLRNYAATGSSARRRRLACMVLLLITVATMLSCREPDITDRPYMGFTPLPYDLPTEPHVEAITYGFLKFHSTLMAHHLDDGIPWQEALDGAPFPASLEANIQGRLKNTQPGQKVYLALTPLAKLRNELAETWGEQQGQPRSGPWAERDFDSPEVKMAYLNYCRRMIQRFNPDYFAYAIEANLWPLEDPQGFMRLAHMLAEVYITLKSEFPALPIFLTLLVEDDEKFANRLHYTRDCWIYPTMWPSAPIPLSSHRSAVLPSKNRPANTSAFALAKR